MPKAETFGKYRLVRPLAQGGMAEVFLAKQMGLQGFEKNVVIKRILPHLTKDPEFLEMFLDEARLVARLAHPNVVQVFDIGEVDGQYFLAMEYLAGEDLSAIIGAAREQGKPVPSQIVANIVGCALDGLQYVHALADEAGNPLHIVHRDVSPSNIFVTYQGVVKILDFGIAKAEGKLVATEIGRLKGKYSYMSPEQVLGEQLDGRSDLFSLGTVLYEALTGVRLFRRDGELATVRAIADEPILPPSTHRSDLPMEMDRIVMKALTRVLKDRYQTAQQMRQDLDHYLAARTYVPSANQLRDYLLLLFGEPHVQDRLRLPASNPSMKSLRPLVPKARDESRTISEVSALDVVLVDEQHAKPARLWPWSVGAAAVVAAVGGLTLAYSQRDPPQKAQPTVTAPQALPALPAPLAAPEVAVPTAIATPTAIGSAGPSAAQPPASAAPLPPDPAASQMLAHPLQPSPSPSHKARAPGQLQVVVLPYALVYVDGKRRGMTPMPALSLPAGRHTVKLVNDDLAAEKSLTVDVRPGETTWVRQRLK
jgi:serine/threonine-protein kinase